MIEQLNNQSEKPNELGRRFTVRVPASTSNLGAGFDCLSLALQLYLTVTATVLPGADKLTVVEISGEGGDELPLTGDNLIIRAMRFAAEGEGVELPAVNLKVQNDLPLGRGLGSSAATIVAGIKLMTLVCNHQLSLETMLRYATDLEGHADNVAAALHGGLAVTCVSPNGGVLVAKKGWPDDVKVIVVSPESPLNTAAARKLLPRQISLADAVFNLQRVALFGAALESGRYELLWEAMQDRLHQRQRALLVGGLADALAVLQQPGLLGLALSGAGPSVLALANDRLTEIGELIAERFRENGMGVKVRILEVDHEGTRLITP